MEMSFWKIMFRILLAIIIGALAALLFASVLSRTEAYALAVVVAVIELCGALATAQHGAGHGIRFMVRMGGVMLAWPVAAWLLAFAGLHDRGVRIGLAAAVASAVGMGAARHGNGKETARLVAVMIAVAIPAYAMFSAIRGGDGQAVIAACVATAVAPITAMVAHTWPDAHHRRLVAASAICVVAGVAVLARTLIF